MLIDSKPASRENEGYGRVQTKVSLQNSGYQQKKDFLNDLRLPPPSSINNSIEQSINNISNGEKVIERQRAQQVEMEKKQQQRKKLEQIYNLGNGSSINNTYNDNTTGNYSLPP
jgi:hypothetical protein